MVCNYNEWQEYLRKNTDVVNRIPKFEASFTI